MTTYDNGYTNIPGTRHVAEELDSSRCWQLLQTTQTGRVGFLHGNRIEILPVNHLVHEQAIYFRTGEDGAMASSTPQQNASFQTDETHSGRMTGWSVLVSGPLERVDDASLITFLAGRQWEEPWAEGLQAAYLRLAPELVTGRRFHMD
jgi:uncharacterized protein